MGTGKTRIALDLAGSTNAALVLVLAPAAVLGVWEPQIAKHYPAWSIVLTLDRGTSAEKGEALRTALLRGGADETRRMSTLFVIASYESCWRQGLANVLTDVEWDLVIADEIHRVKAPGGKASMWLARVLRDRAAKRIGLTGTPMPHSPLDIYAQARFLDPRAFGTSAALFRRRWCAMGGFEMRQVKGLLNPILFSERLADMMHTIEADVLTLPPTTDTVIPVTLDPPALKHARAIVRDFMTTLEGGERVTAPMAATTILRLQQIGSGFARDVDGVDHPVGDEKGKALAVLFEGIAPDEPIVVFARFKHDLQRIHHEAEDAGRRSYELSGQRRELDDWRCDASQGGGAVFAVQIASGNMGIDFTTCKDGDSTRARYAIYYSLTHALGEWEQSRARIHRPGQHRAVQYYVLQAGVDARIMRSLGRKQDAVNDLIEDVRRHGEGAFV